MSKKSTVAVGDRVGYSRQFLKSIGGRYAEAQRRATVISVSAPTSMWKDGVATVKWDDSEIESTILPVNLARIGSVAFTD